MIASLCTFITILKNYFFISTNVYIHDIIDLYIFCLENESTEIEVKTDFGDEGHLLASASKDRTIRIWSTLKGRQLVSFRLPKSGGPQGDTGRGKLWAAIVWSHSNPRNLISSSFGYVLNYSFKKKDMISVILVQFTPL